MATSLDPQTLQQLLMLMQQQGMSGNGATQWQGTGGLADWTVDQRRDIIGRSNDSMDGADLYSDPITRLYQQTGSDTWKTDGDTANVFDEQGSYIGPSSGDSTALGLAKAIAMSVGSYYAGGALSGGEAAAGGAGGGSAGLSGWDAAMADLASSGGLTAGDMAAAGGAASAGGAAGGGAAGGGGAASAVGGAGSAASSLLNSGDALKIGGALVGAASSQDQEKTTSVEPWKDAQPTLLGLLQQGQDLSAKYQAQPFNQAQRTGLGNMGQIYDFINQNAGGLLSGAQANASGANQFVRGQPRLLTGSAPMTGAWNPGSYGNFLG